MLSISSIAKQIFSNDVKTPKTSHLTQNALKKQAIQSQEQSTIYNQGELDSLQGIEIEIHG